MAKDFKMVSGSLFSGNPIIISVTPTVSVPVTFHKMKVKVDVQLKRGEYSYPTHTFVLSVPAEAGKNVVMDISSSLRAAADDFTYKSDSNEVPYLVYKLEAWEEYFLAGEFYKDEPISFDTTKGCRALLGGISDMERFMADTPFRKVQNFSRKPDYGEIVGEDETLMVPIPLTGALGMTSVISFGQKSKSLSMKGKSGIVPIRYSDIYNPSTDYFGRPKEDYVVRTVYVDAPSPNRFQFLFVNRQGALETISAMCLPEESQQYKQTTQMRSTMETFEQNSIFFHQASASPRKYRMSTGYINEEWANWWLTDVFTAPLFWMKWKEKYVPCIVQPDDDVKVLKRSSADIIALNFTVQLSIGF